MVRDGSLSALSCISEGALSEPQLMTLGMMKKGIHSPTLSFVGKPVLKRIQRIKTLVGYYETKEETQQKIVCLYVYIGIFEMPSNSITCAFINKKRSPILTQTQSRPI